MVEDENLKVMIGFGISCVYLYLFMIFSKSKSWSDKNVVFGIYVIFF